MLTSRGVRPGLEVTEMKELKVKRMNINVEVSLHDAFKAATAAKGENMTDVLLKFVEEYVTKNGLAAKQKGRRG
jgi:ParG